MTEASRHDIELGGCTPEPLLAYLKALGILRLVGEQEDAEARGWWRSDAFCLRSNLDRDALTRFFLDGYRPTPIVAPWAGGSGFFSGDSATAVNALCSSDTDRGRSFADVIHHVRRILESEGIAKKPKDGEKARLIRRYRRELPDETVRWMDAAMVLQQEDQGFAPLLGTGGNDGHLDFAQNFMQRVVGLGLHKANPVDETSQAQLEHSLFGSPVRLDRASVGQFSPGRSGGPNATQGMEGKSLDNPWDFVLMLEGTLLLAGAAVKRFGGEREAGRGTQCAFPFTVRSVAAGFDSSALKDQTRSQSRGELWLPLWSRPTSGGELRQLFGEGRADVSGRPASNGVDFARAIAGLGVDSGIAGFSRLAFLRRSGKAYLAAPIARLDVRERSEADLLRQIDPWLDAFRRAAGHKLAPPRFGVSLRAIDSAVFDFCKYGGKGFFQRIIVALGAAQRELCIAERFRDKRRLRPLAGLSCEWIGASDDGSLEFAAARALASIHDSEGKTGPLRANIQPVDWKRHCHAWAEKDRGVVWNAADLPTNLASVLQRRLMDGQRAGCDRLPLASPCAASLGAIAAFIGAELDYRRIEELVWGLTLIGRWCPSGQTAGAYGTPPVLPRQYALLKLLFLPAPLLAYQVGEAIRWRLARGAETGLVIRPEPRILPLLRAGRVGEACAIAARRLRASGLPPMPGPISGVVRDNVWSEYAGDTRHAQRLAAALLMPVSSNSVNILVQLVCRDTCAVAEALALSSEGEQE